MYDYELMNLEGPAEFADTDNNGTPDVFVNQLDQDGDGILDTLIKSFDYDQDGIIDHQDLFVDTNGDGLVDMAGKLNDIDGDGVFESIEAVHDYNGDGMPDASEVIIAADVDGDGELEMIHQVDVNGDGIADETSLLTLDPETGELVTVPIEPEFASSSYDDLFSADVDQYDPSQSNPDKVIGNPEEALEHWECQYDTQRCALYAQKFVIEEYTGQEISIDELAETAKENGWFDEGGGTGLLNINKMLDYYGVENEMSFNNDIESLQEHLANGDRVIVALDSAECWYGDNDNIFTPSQGPNHAVEVVGIDYTDPENPMVILNDSGPSNGRGELVPLDVFDDAWEDGNRQMVVCTA